MANGAGVTGAAVAAARAGMARRDAELGDADRQLADVLAAAHRVAAESARRIDGIEAEIDAAVAGQFVGAPAGAQEMARLLLAKQREIADVVTAAVRESAAKAAVLQRLRDRYDLSDAT